MHGWVILYVKGFVTVIPVVDTPNSNEENGIVGNVVSPLTMICLFRQKVSVIFVSAVTVNYPVVKLIGTEKL